MKRLVPALALLLASALPSLAAWTVSDGANPDATGRRVEVQKDGKLVARFIYGEGEIKPYLQLFGVEADSLNEWGKEQKFPHHRGFYIGWNKIAYEPEAGKKQSVDLWHFNKGGSMKVTKIEKAEARPDSVAIVADIEWRGNTKDAQGEHLLLKERRELVISQPDPKMNQVDATFALTAARDLRLDGDLQHAGVHFRGSKELLERTKETSYTWEPEVPSKNGKAESTEFKWARLTFPIGQRWYSATLLNSPKNPVEELSTRDYGRFGFFFKRDLKADENLTLRYRVVTQLEGELKDKPKAEDTARMRKVAQEEYQAFTSTLK
ncbi:MAG: DUF6807 family protein [Chthoniobacteraceae bacterium]